LLLCTGPTPLSLPMRRLLAGCCNCGHRQLLGLTEQGFIVVDDVLAPAYYVSPTDNQSKYQTRAQ